MKTNKFFSASIFGIAIAALLLTIVWDVSVHEGLIVKARSRPQYPRSEYYTKAPRGSFTFVSRYTLFGEHLDHTTRMEVTEAQDSRGRSLWARKQFNSASDTVALIESAQVIERPNGKLTALYGSMWQVALGKPMFVTYGEDRKFIPSHTLPEKNCISPEPALKFLRYESVRIAGQDYPTAVIEIRDPSISETMTTWFSMTPSLGCLELKSVSEYITPDHQKGMTVHEPVSLTLGEPNPHLLDIETKIATNLVEVVPYDQWEPTIKSKTKEYEAALARQPRFRKQ